MNIKIHSSSSQIVQKKNRKMIGTGNSKDKKLYVNKSGAMMLIKKTESIKNNESIFTNTFSNQNIFSNTKKIRVIYAHLFDKIIGQEQVNSKVLYPLEIMLCQIQMCLLLII